MWNNMLVHKTANKTNLLIRYMYYSALYTKVIKLVIHVGSHE